MKNSIKKDLFLRKLSLRLKKKILHRKEIYSMISMLKNLFFKKHAVDNKKLSLFLSNLMLVESLQKQSFFINYIIYFSFSPINTFLYVTDSLGNLKFKYSAGLMGFKGKQKKKRLKLLYSFLKELRKLKMSVLKKKPIALIFNNVDFYKHFLMKKLKKLFFIRILKSYQIQSYNGCRKKKRLRKKI